MAGGGWFVWFFCRTSERSHGRERRVNEKEIEELMARCEPRLVRFFCFLHRLENR